MDAARGNGAGRDAAAGRTVVVIPTLDEEQSIAEVVRSIPRTIASRVIVADGGCCDATVARAKAAGADVIDGRTKKSKSNGLSDVAGAVASGVGIWCPDLHHFDIIWSAAHVNRLSLCLFA